MNKTNRIIHLLILAALILIMPTTHASAMLTRCRTDPHFKLSNGDIVTVTLDVGTDITNIKGVDYILHVPAGVTITKVTYTARADKKAVEESYELHQDSPVGTYATETVVTTQTPGRVEVTVFTRANGVKEASLSGYSGQAVVITINSKK